MHELLERIYKGQPGAPSAEGIEVVEVSVTYRRYATSTQFKVVMSEDGFAQFVEEDRTESVKDLRKAVQERVPSWDGLHLFRTAATLIRGDIKQVQRMTSGDAVEQNGAIAAHLRKKGVVLPSDGRRIADMIIEAIDGLIQVNEVAIAGARKEREKTDEVVRSLRAELKRTQKKLSRAKSFNGHDEVATIMRTFSQFGYRKPNGKRPAEHVADVMKRLAIDAVKASVPTPENTTIEPSPTPIPLRRRPNEITGKIELQGVDAIRGVVHSAFVPERSVLMRIAAEPGPDEDLANLLGDVLIRLRIVDNLVDGVKALDPVAAQVKAAIKEITGHRNAQAIPYFDTQFITHTAVVEEFRHGLSKEARDAEKKHAALHAQIEEAVDTFARLGWITPRKEIERMANRIAEQDWALNPDRMGQ